MTEVLMHESRRLELPLETMVDVLVEFESMRNRWPERAKLEGARVEPTGSIVLSVRQSGHDQPVDRAYSLPIIAAAIIHYCAKMHVPIPRKASKSVAITPSGVAMILEGTLFLQRQHAEPRAGFMTKATDTSALSDPPTPSTEPAPEADPAVESTGDAGGGLHGLDEAQA